MPTTEIRSNRNLASRARNRIAHAFGPFAIVTAVLSLAPMAIAQDLVISSVQINQAVQFGSTTLVGDNTTVVRVSVGTGGQVISNVDAVLRMSVNNVPLAGPPIFSTNGPITAVASPVLDNVNQTLNFMVLPPISNDVDFTIEVNPNRNVAETNYANNIMVIPNKIFVCRKMIELPYVPINYTFNGAGLPPSNLMEPGIGDGFVRGIYTTEWNYHKSPTPALTWSTNIETSTSALHNTLNDIRVNQLPALGQPLAPFIFAYLPGNPFSGNGQANGIPGTSAFGNTDQTRSQRTTAHELGHCFGLQHNSTTIGTVGFDEEHHLWNTQGLAQTFPATRNDIMVAGLLTNQAWINSNSYNVMLSNAAAACPPSDGEPGVPIVPVLRISGVITHDTRQVQLDPVTRIRRGVVSDDQRNGDIRIEAVNAAGQVIWSRGSRTDTARELCEPDANGKMVLAATGAFHVLAPTTVGGELINEVRIVNTADGRMLANRVRTANSPQVHLLGIEQIIADDGVLGAKRKAIPVGERITGRVRINWSAVDADGDALSSTLLYSPDDGDSWHPVVVNTAADFVEFDATDLPASLGDRARFVVSTTDGLNTTEADSGNADDGGLAFGPGTPPETFLLTPNTGNQFPQLASIAFHATSWDKENLLLDGASMQWTSSIDGAIGSGRLFTKADLSPGTHLITITGTDSSLMSSSKSITITILPRTVITPDCNNNWINDTVEILNGTAPDVNGNNIPDECESICASDVNGDDVVNVTDLLAVITAWGPCPAAPAPCPANVNITSGSETDVDVADLLQVISDWGDCP